MRQSKWRKATLLIHLFLLLSWGNEYLPVAGAADSVLPLTITADTYALSIDLKIDQYPLSTAGNPVYEASLVKPVSTNKIRLVVHDGGAHITEIRLFGPETKKYPPALLGKTVGIEAPNLATHAKVTASGAYEGRPEGAVVDGMMTFASRWYSGSGKPPHWLVIDMGDEQVVDHIQMVSGYHSKGNAGWNAIVQDFHFEYWSDGQWKRVETQTRQVQQAGALAIKLVGEGRKNLVFLHDNERLPRFAVGTFLRGNLKILERYAPERVEELQKGMVARLEIKKAGAYYHFFCNGMKVAAFDSREHDLADLGPCQASVFTQSTDTVYEVVDARCQKVRRLEDNYLSNLAIRDEQSDIVIPSDFDPFDAHALAILPQATEALVLELECSGDQEIYVNGQKAKQLRLNEAQITRADPIEVLVKAVGQSPRTYVLDILPVPPAGPLKLAYQDDFDGDKLNRADWIYRRGKRWESLNAPDAVSVREGNLRIELSVEDGVQKVGGIISKRAFGYGYYETRAKLTEAKGWHSAFWNHGLQKGMVEMGEEMPDLPGNYTEIDCFESVSGDAFSTNFHYHKYGLFGTGKLHRASVADDFHIFAWLWTPQEVCYYFDGQMVDRRTIYPPIRPQNVWLTCVAHPDAQTGDLPQEILFDYFRYYRFVEQPDLLGDKAIIVATDSPGYRETGKWESAAQDGAQSYQLETTTRKSTAKGSSCRWSCALPQKGAYEIFVWNPYIVIDPVINERAYDITTVHGVVTASYNPRIAGQNWISLGVFEFGQDALVTLSVQDDGVFRADAIAFVPIDAVAY